MKKTQMLNRIETISPTCAGNTLDDAKQRLGTYREIWPGDPQTSRWQPWGWRNSGILDWKR